MNTNISKSRAALVALGVAAGCAGALAPAASAYTGATAQCAGATIYGGGASLQKAAQTKWGADQLTTTTWTLTNPATQWSGLTTASTATSGFGFAGVPGTGGCPTFRSASKKIAYASVGSGGGRNSWAANGVAGNRMSSAAFIATDEPANTTEETNLETVGLTAATVSETIPVSQAAIALIVNLPTGCSLASVNNRTATISNLEKIWWGTSTTWGQLLGTSALTPASCNTQAVKRIARADSSGSSFALKKVLNVVNNHWSTPTDYTSPANNTNWPAAVTKPTATGGGAVATLVNSTPGSLGYVDLATARGANFGFTNATTDKTFWLRINAPAAGGTTVTNDPAKDALQTTTNKGANCGAARVYTGTPASTQSNWFNVTGAKATYAAGEYPICTLTYTVAYDRYRNQPGRTEPQARTVFDYTNWAVQAAGGQSLLAANDYQALPTTAPAGVTPLRTIAAAGAARIDW